MSPFTPTPVAKLVRDLLVVAEDDIFALFTAADAAGVDLADVMDVLADPYPHHLESVVYDMGELSDDPIFALAEHCGVERAAAIIARTTAWSGHDVAAHHASVTARHRAQHAIVDELPILETYALASAPELDGSERGSLVERIARVYPLDALALLADRASDDDAHWIRHALVRPLAALNAFEALRDEVDDAVLLRVLERFFDVRIAGDVPDSERVVATYALLLRESARNLAPAVHLGSTRGPVDWWLPILRRHGFRPSLAALHLLEKCERAVDVGDILATAGYDDDEVLRALLDNGVGTRSSLAALRAGGWNLDRMLESLFRRRVLLPEVRAHLEDLGIPRAAQRPVLLRHWPAAIVDLVLHEATTMRRLPSGDSDPEAT